MAYESFPLRPRDWLLLMFDGAAQPIDRVRVQKSMFLFAQRSKAPAYEKYAFEPYDYGPFSAAIYPDLERLESSGLLRADERSRSPAYHLTALGRDAAQRLKVKAAAQRLTTLHRIRDWVLERNFNQLLTDVYAMYPEYAARSVFRQR
jgi:uncharacterized protein YwgA